MKKLLIIILASLAFAGSKYCSNLTQKERKTFIYVDKSSIKKGYYQHLIKKLKGTFLPHEKVVVLAFNPQNQNIKEVFNSCVPKLSKEEIKKIKGKGGFFLFSESPIDKAKEDYQFFISALKGVLKKIKPIEDIENKQIIEMFYNESNRFETPLNRVIIYSDMMENSEDFPIKKIISNQYSVKDFKEYKSDFNYANIYVLLSEKKLKASSLKNLADFWDNYFEYNKADLKNFNTELKFSKVSYLKNKIFAGKLIYPDNSFYRVKLLFNYAPDGKVINAWFIINGVDAVPLGGKVYIISAKLKKGDFKVITNKKFHVFRSTEKIEINFKGKIAKGVIISENTNLEVITPKGHHFVNPKIIIELKEDDEI